MVYSQTVETTKPDLYAHLDYRRYLADWFAWKKATNPRFSHRVFARLAGQKSPSLLKSVIDGKRNLSPANVGAFGQAMDLGTEQQRFFAALVALDQSPTDAERNAAWAEIRATRRFREARAIEGEAFAFFENWYCVAVFELVKHPGFQPEPRWIARQLQPRITESQARSALHTLRQLGLIQTDDSGQTRQVEASVVTPQEVQGLAVSNFHREMCQRAHDAVAGFDASERHLLSVTVTVPAALLPVLKSELNAVQKRLLDLCDAREHEPGRVMQLNLQLFPLAAEPES